MGGGNQGAWRIKTKLPLANWWRTHPRVGFRHMYVYSYGISERLSGLWNTLSHFRVSVLSNIAPRGHPASELWFISSIAVIVLHLYHIPCWFTCWFTASLYEQNYLSVSGKTIFYWTEYSQKDWRKKWKKRKKLVSGDLRQFIHLILSLVFCGEHLESIMCVTHNGA